LLDAPCSATGTFRRHPDVLHNRNPKSVADLVRLQDKLLPKAADLTASLSLRFDVKIKAIFGFIPDL